MRRLWWGFSRTSSRVIGCGLKVALVSAWAVPSHMPSPVAFEARPGRMVQPRLLVADGLALATAIGAKGARKEDGQALLRENDRRFVQNEALEGGE